jgi:hypothetical protein
MMWRVRSNRHLNAKIKKKKLCHESSRFHCYLWIWLPISPTHSYSIYWIDAQFLARNHFHMTIILNVSWSRTILLVTMRWAHMAHTEYTCINNSSHVITVWIVFERGMGLKKESNCLSACGQDHEMLSKLFRSFICVILLYVWRMSVEFSLYVKYSHFVLHVFSFVFPPFSLSLSRSWAIPDTW